MGWSLEDPGLNRNLSHHLGDLSEKVLHIFQTTPTLQPVWSWWVAAATWSLGRDRECDCRLCID